LKRSKNCDVLIVWGRGNRIITAKNGKKRRVIEGKLKEKKKKGSANRGDSKGNGVNSCAKGEVGGKKNEKKKKYDLIELLEKGKGTKKRERGEFFLNQRSPVHPCKKVQKGS